MKKESNKEKIDILETRNKKLINANAQIFKAIFSNEALKKQHDGNIEEIEKNKQIILELAKE